MRSSIALGTVFLFVIASAAPGSVITLSTAFVSEVANPPAAVELLADIFFELPGPVVDDVSVALPTTLTITIDNRTDETTVWEINQYYFNVPDNVTGMAFASNFPGWTPTFDNTAGGGTLVSGFGMFDFAVVGRLGGRPVQILPGTSKEFIVDLTGSGSITENDFMIEMSEPDGGGGNTFQTVAAHFTDGPGGASAYGGVVPEPGAMALLVLGGLLAVRRRNR